ncbi:hypothetical protein MBLNU230_g2939t1 [Neophaeotheca triangularis]
MASSATSSTAINSPQPAASQDETHAQARAAVLASLHSAGSNYDSQLQRRAADLQANSAAIAKQEAEVMKNAKTLSKESAKWEKETGKATEGLKEIGDVQNWAELMERDMLVLEETMRMVEGGEREESESWGSLWR